MAERKVITCPETARLAEIELDRTPVGVVILSCSRFVPRCEIACTRECAKRIDNRERNDDRAERVLIAYAGDDDRTTQVARTLAEQLSRDGFTVELADAHVAAPPPPQDYDAVVIGAREGLGAYARPIMSYLREHGSSLGTMPAFFFSVRGTSRLPNLSRPQEHVEGMIGATGWQPTEWTTFDGASPTARSLIDAFALRIAEQVPVTEHVDAP